MKTVHPYAELIQKSTKFLLLIPVTLFLVLTMMGQANAQKIITFDAPGAGTGPYQGTGCFAYTDCSVLINDEGTITGYFLDANNVFHGFVRSPEGKFTSFDAPGADLTPGDYNGTTPAPSTMPG
jgi:hypothetical protein